MLCEDTLEPIREFVVLQRDNVVHPPPLKLRVTIKILNNINTVFYLVPHYRIIIPIGAWLTLTTGYKIDLFVLLCSVLAFI